MICTGLNASMMLFAFEVLFSCSSSMKFDAVLISLLNLLEEFFSFAFLEGIILLAGDKLPVDEGYASALKTYQHGIRQRTGVDVWRKCIHALLALLLQITLTGTEPDEGGLAVCVLQIGVHMFDQNDSFTCAGRSFDRNDLFCARSGRLVIQEIDTVNLSEINDAHLLWRNPSSSKI